MDVNLDVDLSKTIPVEIEVLLFKYNYVDSLIISKLKREASVSVTSNGVIYAAADDIRRIINRYFRKYIDEPRNSTLENIARSVNTAFFLNGLFTSFKGLKTVYFNISNTRNYSRLYTVDKKKMIGLDFKVKKGVIDLPNFFSIDEIDIINRVFYEVGLNSKNEEYFNIRTSDLIESIMTIEEINKDVFDSSIHVLDILYNFFDQKIENDNPLLIVKTDFSNI